MTPLEWAAFIGIVLGLGGWGINRYLEITGKSPSSRILREENQDLVRRNTDLGSEVDRLKRDVEKMRGQVRALEALIEELRGRDQAAVLKAIEVHEQAAGLRHERMLTVLTEIRDAVKAA